jgi:hypothetical protein
MFLPSNVDTILHSHCRENLKSYIVTFLYILCYGCMVLIVEQGTTTYFSSNCTMEDANLVTQFLKHRNLEAYNSRVFKTMEDGIPTYEVYLQ